MTQSPLPSILTKAAVAAPLWYKDAIIYELHVKAFSDSNGDGVGDFPGLISKLGYLQELGVNTLWLLPFYPSPMRDDGYDIADYCHIHPAFGGMVDFHKFIDEAHRLGLRVITELVINHTSDQHPWFQAARQAPPGSVKRDYTCGATTTRNMPVRGSSSRTLKNPTGPGTRKPKPIIGIASSHTSRT